MTRNVAEGRQSLCVCDQGPLQGHDEQKRDHNETGSHHGILAVFAPPAGRCSPQHPNGHERASEKSTSPVSVKADCQTVTDRGSGTSFDRGKCYNLPYVGWS